MFGGLFIAIDHGNITLERYGAGIPASSPSLIRHRLRHLIGSVPCDGFVVGSTDTLSLEKCVSASVQCIVGLPDQKSSDIDRTTVEEGLAIAISKRLGRPLVKVGVVFPAAESEELREISALFSSLPNRSIVFEPYFDVKSSVKERARILQSIANESSILALKLDCSAETSKAFEISELQSDLGLYLRSDGMSFAEFESALSDHGHTQSIGAIVGSALWRSEIGGLVDGEFAFRQASKKIAARSQAINTLVAEYCIEEGSQQHSI